MKWEKLSYRMKNKMLLALAVVLFVICWRLAFAKTVAEVNRNRNLTKTFSMADVQDDQTQQLQKKGKLLDTLVRHYSMDSLAFEDNFLPDIITAIEGLPVSLSFDEGKQPQEESYNVLQKEVVLRGRYSNIVEAIRAFEKLYFVGSIVYQKGEYRIVLGRTKSGK